jgi:cyclase
MKRASLLTIAFGLLATVAATPVRAQQQDFSQVKVVPTKITNNFFTLDGQGGRMGVLTGPDGIFIVDAQFAPLTERLVASIRQMSNAPLKLLVNTHVHGDHTGGNENFAKLGVTIMSRPKLRERLAKPSPPAGGGQAPAPAPAGALPVIVFDNRTDVNLNGETVHLIPLPGAHTDGDTAVFFQNANVLMTGDVYRSIGYPNIDRANGGTLTGILAALQTLIDTAGPATRVAPGHGDLTDRAGIQSHREMAVTVRDRVSKLMAQGQTLEQIVAAKPTKDFDEKVGNAAMSADRFVGQIYAELRGQGTR